MVPEDGPDNAGGSFCWPLSEETLRCLDDSKMIDGKVINALATYFSLSSPWAFILDSGQTVPDQLTQKAELKTEKHHTKCVIPMFHGKHWVLAQITLGDDRPAVTILDPMANSAHGVAIYRDKVINICRYIGLEDPVDITICRPLTQEDSHNCGIFLTVAQLFAMRGYHMPYGRLHVSSWRALWKIYLRRLTSDEMDLINSNKDIKVPSSSIQGEKIDDLQDGVTYERIAASEAAINAELRFYPSESELAAGLAPSSKLIKSILLDLEKEIKARKGGAGRYLREAQLRWMKVLAELLAREDRAQLLRQLRRDLRKCQQSLNSYMKSAQVSNRAERYQDTGLV